MLLLRTQLLLVARLRMKGALPSFPHVALWLMKGQVYLYLYLKLGGEFLVFVPYIFPSNINGEGP
jgi:hypothetical protein